MKSVNNMNKRFALEGIQLKDIVAIAKHLTFIKKEDLPSFTKLNKASFFEEISKLELGATLVYESDLVKVVKKNLNYPEPRKGLVAVMLDDNLVYLKKKEENGPTLYFVTSPASNEMKAAGIKKDLCIVLQVLTSGSNYRNSSLPDNKKKEFL